MGGRCPVCHKKLLLSDSVAGKCKCGECFCPEHRLAEMHACAYDYVGTAKDALREKLKTEQPKKVAAI